MTYIINNVTKYILRNTLHVGVSEKESQENRGPGEEAGDQGFDILDLLQRKHAISLLLYLDEKGEATMTQVQEDVTRGNNLYDMLDKYERMGIIGVRYGPQEKKPKRLATVLFLESYGKALVSLLKFTRRFFQGEIVIDGDPEEFVNTRLAPSAGFSDEDE